MATEFWTDGSFRDGKCGWAFTYMTTDSGQRKWVVVYGSGGSTNNSAEYSAILYSIQAIIANRLTNSALIVSDSQLCVKTFSEWLPKWKPCGDGWRKPDGKMAKNTEYIKAILALKSQLNFSFRWIPRESEKGNRIADKYADLGREVSGIQTLVIDD